MSLSFMVSKFRAKLPIPSERSIPNGTLDVSLCKNITGKPAFKNYSPNEDPLDSLNPFSMLLIVFFSKGT